MLKLDTEWMLKQINKMSIVNHLISHAWSGAELGWTTDCALAEI